MSDKRMLPAIFFVVGLFLIAIGVGLLTITVTQIVTRDYYGIPVSRLETVQPYVGPGVILVLLGFGVWIYGLFGLMAYGIYEIRTKV